MGADEMLFYQRDTDADSTLDDGDDPGQGAFIAEYGCIGGHRTETRTYRNQLVRSVDDVGRPSEKTHEYRYDCFGRRLGRNLDTANSIAEARF